MNCYDICAKTHDVTKAVGMLKWRRFVVYFEVIFFISTGVAEPPTRSVADQYVDDVLTEVGLKLRKSGMYTIRLGDITLIEGQEQNKVLLEGIFGRLDGVVGNLRRAGSCPRHETRDGHIIVYCFLNINGVAMEYEIVPTETFNGTNRNHKSFKVSVKVKDSKIVLETSRKEDSTEPPTVKHFTLIYAVFDLPSVEYNKPHAVGLLVPTWLNKYLTTRLEHALTAGAVRSAVESAVGTTYLPAPMKTK
ncbi:hypothetical protein V5799_034268 [Amblyomma americanum]|uniref:Uncharacterized protein n=1 Tax=Amblyomma americanum TaxID=6943 RepID=A0AAQ4DKY3_AMBAM